MIIECPACQTRYDIKADLPPEGRSVRCKKCATVWRAMPKGEDVAEDPANDLALAAGRAAHQIAQAFAASEDKQVINNGLPASKVTSPDAGVSSGQQPVSETATDTPAETLAGRSIGNGHDTQEHAAADHHAADATASSHPANTQNESSGEKIRWFENFRKKHGARPQLENAEADTAISSGHAAVAETIPFPSRPFLVAEHALFKEPEESEGEIRTLEEAREAVRDVFSSLNDARPAIAQHSYARSVLDDQTPHDENQQTAHDGTAVPQVFEESHDARTARQTEHEQDAARLTSHQTEGMSEDRQVQSAGSGEWSSSSLRDENDGSVYAQNRRDDSEAQAENGKDGNTNLTEGDAQEAEDPGAHLRASLTRIPQDRDFAASHTDAPNDLSLADSRIALELESQLRQKPQTQNADEWRNQSVPAFFKRPALPLENLEKHGITDEKEAEPQDDGSYDQRLYRELEETREHVSERSRGRGGLALAAAWGLFLCAVAGVVAGFFGFRENAAEQLPGLAPVYSALGMPVTVQPLLFENVQHRWDASGGKPALVITGSIYNRAKRKVRLPEFYVAIKHRNPELDRDYPVTFKTNRTKIRAGEREEFEIELVAPDPSIKNVELEMRSVR